MSNVFVVKARAEFPKSGAKWTVDVGDGTPEQQLAYVNLGYDLIGVAMARLGVAMSEAVLGDDAKMKALQRDVE
jgi:hypothetical protein